MAKFGQQIIAGLLQPSYQQGMFQVGQQLGAIPAQRRQLEQAQAEKVKADKVLSNLQAAAKAKASKSPNSQQLVPLVESMSLAQLQEYLKPSTPSEFTLSEGQVRFRGGQEIARVDKPADPSEITYVTDDLVNPETGITESVRVGFNPQGQKISETVIGVVPSKDGAGGVGGRDGKQTLSQFFKEANIEVDLDTLEGLQQAQQAAYFNLSNASLANSIGTLIEQKKDPGVKEGLDILQTQPEVKQAQEDLVLVNKFKSLSPLTEVDTAGASRLLQRIVTATAPNDLKAVAELNAFTSAQGLKDRIDDFFSMVVTGQLSEETIREYQNTINAIEELSNRQITNAARRLSIYGNEREQKAAQNVLNFYGASTARVVPE